MRSIIRGEYNDVVFGWNFRPQLILQWDIGGIAPMPLQNFVQGRKQFDIGTDILVTDSLAAHQLPDLPGRRAREHLRRRDNLSFAMSYAF